MATKIGLGVPMPLLAPATAAWSVPFAAYYMFLQNRIVYYRLAKGVLLGDTCDSNKGTSDPMYLASRCQINFVENVPMALILAAFAELNGGDRKYINYALGALLAFRVSHAELGLINGMGVGRPVGYYGTQAVLLGLAGYVASLVKDYVLSS